MQSRRQQAAAPPHLEAGEEGGDRPQVGRVVPGALQPRALVAGADARRAELRGGGWARESVGRLAQLYSAESASSASAQCSGKQRARWGSRLTSRSLLLNQARQASSARGPSAS